MIHRNQLIPKVRKQGKISDSLKPSKLWNTYLFGLNTCESESSKIKATGNAFIVKTLTKPWLSIFFNSNPTEIINCKCQGMSCLRYIHLLLFSMQCTFENSSWIHRRMTAARASETVVLTNPRKASSYLDWMHWNPATNGKCSASRNESIWSIWGGCSIDWTLKVVYISGQLHTIYILTGLSRERIRGQDRYWGDLQKNRI